MFNGTQGTDNNYNKCLVKDLSQKEVILLVTVLHVTNHKEPLFVEATDKDGTECTWKFSYSYFKKVNKPHEIFCGLQFHAICFEYLSDIHEDDILYILSRLRGNAEETSSVGHFKPNTLHFVMSEQSSDYTRFVFNHNNKKYISPSLDHSDGDRFAEDMRDLLLDPNEPISNLNLIYEEI